MPNMAVRQMSYTPDVTGTAVDITFKIREDYADALPYFTVPTNTVKCTGALGFSPRAAIVDFEDGSSIRFPIQLRSGPNGVRDTIQTLFALPGAVCIHLDGEKWTTVPTLGNPAINGYAVDPGFADKRAGVVTYESDMIGGDTKVRVAIEISPVVLSSVAIACAETRGTTIDEDGVCTNNIAGFKTRGYYMITKNLTTNGQLRRKAPVAAAGDIVQCGLNAGGVANCVGYKGETIRNAHIYLPPAAAGP